MKRTLSKIGARLWSLAPLVLVLGFLSCGNLFTPPEGPGESPAAGSGLLRLSLGDASPGQRTLVPQDVTFAKYRLSFSGPASESPVELNPSQISGGYTKSLAAGTWDITAEGFFRAGDSAPAARGTVRVTLASGGQANAGILLKPLTDEGTGTFTYRINVTGLAEDVEGGIRLYPHLGNGEFDQSSNQIPVDKQYLSITYGSTLNTDVVIPGINPGEYLLQVELYPGSSPGLTGRVGKTEVVHIYSNLETRADYDISAASFNASTLISGTVNFTVNGAAPAGDYRLLSYLNDGAYGSWLGQTWIYSSGGSPASYSLAIPKPDRAIRVYFFAQYSGHNVSLGSLDIPANAETAAANLSRNFQTVSLSGAITIANSPGGDGYVQVYSSPGWEGQRLAEIWIDDLSSGTKNWSLSLENTGADIPLYFAVLSHSGAYTRRIAPVSVNGGSGDQSGINLGTVDFAHATLYGKAEIRINGQSPASSRIEAYSDWDYQTLIGSGSIDSGGYWAIPLAPGYTGGSATFKVFGTPPGGGAEIEEQANKSVYADSSSDQYIDLGELNLVPKLTLSGTLNFSVNGVPVTEDVFLYLMGDGNQYWQAAVNGGNWSVQIPSDFRGTILFEASGRYNDSFVRCSQFPSETVQSGGDISGISLSAALTGRDFAGTVKKGGVSLEQGDIVAFSSSFNSVEELLSAPSVGYAGIENGGFWFSVLATSGSPLYLYVVEDLPNGNWGFYRYGTALTSSNTSLTLELSSMTFIGELALPGEGN